ncbi:type VI secretion system-associated FHA domain protein TagH [Methylobacter sp. YRD-M1]|uniref:type VI secretion system-associated FHA domain protein TagH n=1 Tax=Methylobacter sp. YRD-M1 TaxID=2911520 RepID=UPI00227B322E|nr:type VI secretion system-associated FHA domain protein TagH [Methylobacter sp. YRD-M1]WAK00367.1 type VI secretion system-associated FHA domain protein TagH [Methylobacter sp. YRD-M1]
MSLLLKIISFKGQPFNAGTEAVFDRHGGTIGRADENTLVLPDPEKFVSRRHASISFENGHYLIKDSSLSGTYIDDQEPPLNNAAQTLIDGMRLRIGEYEILASITPEQQTDDFALGPDLFASPFEADPVAKNPVYAPDSFVPAGDIFNSSSHGDPHLDAFLRDTGAAPFPAHDALLHPDHDKGQPGSEGLMQANISSIHDSFIPPAPAGAPQSSNEIPDDFNFEELFNTGTDAQADDHSWFQGFEPEAVPDSPPVTAEAEPVPEQANSQLLEPATPVSIDPVPVAANFSFQGFEPETVQELLPESIPNGAISKEPELEMPVLKDAVPVADASILEAPTARVQAQPVNQSVASNELFNALLQGAGLENKDLQAQATPENVRRIGLMFRKLVEGTVAVLRSRAEFKSQFRVSVTTIKTTNNNPLKFAVTTEDALTHLVKNGQSGFKDPVEAIDEGFNDIMSHQMAMQAGIQASLAQILRQFDPKLIEKQYEEGLVLQKKSKCWDKYSALYPRVVEQAMEDFFGDAFAEAYEKQMKQLSNLRTDK